jgi:hypothetical protein
MRDIVYGYFTDELDLLNAIKKLHKEGIQIEDVRTPFPVHGLDKVLRYPRSNLPKLAFIAGFAGGAAGLLFQIWVFTKAWPLNIGGKPYLSIPSFIPVTFEVTVLFAAFAIVIGFLVSSNLGPGSLPDILDEEVTDDHFQIIISAKGNTLSQNELTDALVGTGALGVKNIKTEQ